jgi:cob(I)alamin adenosyltransferase
MSARQRPPTKKPQPPARAKASSLVIVNTGDGKGKTTAALGTAMRAVAQGWKVCVVQFMKSGKWKPGEHETAQRLGIEWHSIGTGFTWESKDLSESEAIARDAWETASRLIASGEFRLVVLDEITYPLNYGWIDVNRVVEAIRARPKNVTIVATGRDAPPELIEVADTATEMTKVKHAYDRGVLAIRGIDF